MAKNYIQHTKVRALAKRLGKRVSPQYLDWLDKWVADTIMYNCHMSSKMTLRNCHHQMPVLPHQPKLKTANASGTDDVVGARESATGTDDITEHGRGPAWPV